MPLREEGEAFQIQDEHKHDFRQVACSRLNSENPCQSSQATDAERKHQSCKSNNESGDWLVM